MSECKWFFPENTFEICHCLDVYDGDTITLKFKFGNEYYKDKCRLYGINTPEIRTRDDEEKKNGYKSKEYLKSLIDDKDLYIYFHKKGKFGRPLITIYLNKKDAENNMYKDSINQKLIDDGYAIEYNC